MPNDQSCILPIPSLTNNDWSVQSRGRAARAAHHHGDLEPQLGSGDEGVGEHKGGSLGLAVSAAAAVVAAHLLAKLQVGQKGSRFCISQDESHDLFSEPVLLNRP